MLNHILIFLKVFSDNCIELQYWGKCSELQKWFHSWKFNSTYAKECLWLLQEISNKGQRVYQCQEPVAYDTRKSRLINGLNQIGEMA